MVSDFVCGIFLILTGIGNGAAASKEIGNMNRRLSRRSFLGSAAMASATALLPGSVTAQAGKDGKKAVAQSVAEDSENQILVSSPVAKVQWQAKPFPMPSVRLLPSRW
jgi:hypothetical protein